MVLQPNAVWFLWFCLVKSSHARLLPSLQAAMSRVKLSVTELLSTNTRTADVQTTKAFILTDKRFLSRSILYLTKN